MAAVEMTPFLSRLHLRKPRKRAAPKPLRSFPTTPTFPTRVSSSSSPSPNSIITIPPFPPPPNYYHLARALATEMNHCVLGFELDDDRRKTLSSLGEDLLEILWRNGPVAHPVLSQGELLLDAEVPTSTVTAAAEAELFTEDEDMASWLQYQIDEGDDGRAGLYGQLLGAGLVAAAEEPAVAASRGLRVGDSSEAQGGARVAVAAARSCGVPGTCEGAASRDERKRKARDGGGAPACQNEDVDFESGGGRKEARRTVLARRTRAAEVHNLSERRRRDRINEKMKALQELIPRCNKTDKASMLDEAIEYLKSLQFQVQMMSMGCNMGPMMYPGIQTYSPPMGMGMNMGLGVGIDMNTGLPMGNEMGAGGVARPMLPFRPVFSGPTIPGTRPNNLEARPYMPMFHPSNMVSVDQFRAQASNQQDAGLNSVSLQGSNIMWFQDFVDLWHTYSNPHGLHTLPQNRATLESGTSTDFCNTNKSK